MEAINIRATVVRRNGTVFESEVHHGVTRITSDAMAGSDGLMLWRDRDRYEGSWVYPFSGFFLEIEAV